MTYRFITAGLTLCTLMLPMAAQAIGKTPGTYTHYRFAPQAQHFDAVDFAITVNQDPGYTANTYWAHQFNLVGTSSGAYTGMQSNGGSPRTFLFSAWDTVDARPGSEGSYCVSFSGEGEGRSCRMHKDWEAGHSYRFHVAYEEDDWLKVTVTDTTTNASFVLGSIKTAARAISPAGMVNWAEYFEWNSDRATCLGQPYSKATFDLPVGMSGNAAATATISGTSTSATCPGFSKVNVISKGSQQENGIGNSRRRALLDDKGLCMDAATGLNQGVPIIAYQCTGRPNQAWVSTRDGTLALRDNLCLEASRGGYATVQQCTDNRATQQWQLRSNHLYSPTQRICLASLGSGQPLQATSCFRANRFTEQ